MATNNATNTSNPITVAQGGTGLATLTSGSVQVGNGTGAVTQVAVGATGTLLVGSTGAAPAFATSATGDFTFTSTTAGATRTLTVSNTNNSNAASNALDQITTGGASAGDPFTTYTVTGATSFSQGIDNSDSDKYKISASTALGTTDTFRMTTAGERTLPLNPSFYAYCNASILNVTGDGTSYQVVFDTEQFDQNSDFNTGTGIFTAPVAGLYLLGTSIDFDQLGVHTVMTMNISVSSGLIYWLNIENPLNTQGGGAYVGRLCRNGTALCSMAAGVTAQVNVVVNGSTKTVDILGSAGGGESFFWGNLIS